MPIKEVDAIMLSRWIEHDEAILIDVREPGEHASQAIPGAVSLPLRDVCAENLPPHEGKKLVMHCQIGKRGFKACEELLAQEPTLQLYHLAGGMNAWRLAGEAVQRSGKRLLPLDQQVQLTIGLVVLLGVVLGYFMHPYFLILSAFFGLGLVNTGLTGWCGLALLMAKMPWNQSN